jgi:hypothetical protein
MSRGRIKGFTGLLMAGVFCLPLMAVADTQSTHRAHAKKKEPPPPLPSGTQGPVPQVPLDSLPAVAPEVTYEDGMLTIVAPNSTLGDILRSVRKHTSADIDVPATASERVVTRLGPAPAREVMSELLNGSRFNYILLGSPQDANALTKVVLVAKTGPDTTPPATQAENNSNPNANNQPPTPQPVAEAQDAETPDDTPDDNNAADQNSAESDQPADQPGVKTPQQLLQEMQQRQMLMQQQQGAQPGVQPGYPPAPGMPIPHQPQPPQQQ